MKEAVRRLSDDRKGLPKTAVEVGPVLVSSGVTKPGTIIVAPDTLSLDPRERDRFLSLLYTYRWESFVAPTLDQHGRYTTLVDLRDVRTLELDAALVLVAEYSRNCKGYSYAPLIDDANWAPEIVSLLDQLGFYSFVDAVGRVSDPAAIQPTRAKQFVRFDTGEQVDGTRAKELINSLSRIAGDTPKRQVVYNGLVEAMMNVNNHAYEDRPPEVYGPVDAWWIAGAYDEEENTLTFAVYDQGVGIPTRIPADETYFTALKRLLKGSEDADLIEAAIRLGETSTDRPERGNGLSTICKVAEELDGSSVRILSGRGEVTYFSHGGLEKKVYGNPFCGTLVKWTLKLPSETKPVSGAEA